MADASPMSGKIALVTGASRGIGKAGALALAGAGAHVVAVARTQGALEELDDEIRAAGGEKPTLVPMDLTEGDNLDHLGLALHNRFGRLDVLLHAAAILGPLTPVAHLEPKHWDRVVAANLTASYRLIRSVEPLLKAAGPARAIFLTSGAAARPRAFWGGYAATKAGMEALVRCWADEIEDTGVRAMLVDPGKMRTRMRAEAYPGEMPESVPDPAEIGPYLIGLLDGDPGLPTETFSYPMWREGNSR
ncbi:MAG: short-chain dehydrogenase/reductase [Caulobacteraceae bacterium]|nr:short-chain dehydrogenase/reductase [Caulobacteraceae bacterium]